MERGELAGRYELREQLGDSTWLAADRELGRDVVVRFGRVAGATLSHPAIARVFDQGEEAGEPYAVVEYLPGGTLAERGALTEESAAGLAAALAYAHDQGVAHGAVGADAVLFDAEGRAKLTGFTGAGDPAADVAALSALRGEYAVTEVRSPEAATAVVPPPPPPAQPPDRPSRRALVAAIVAGLLLVAAGIAAALLAGGNDDGGSGATITTDPLTSATVPTDTDEEPEPPPATTDETTTATTDTGPATTDTEPATTETQPPTTETVAPPVPTEPPLPSLPATTELPSLPNTTVQDPPPPTTTTTETQE